MRKRNSLSVACRFLLGLLSIGLPCSVSFALEETKTVGAPFLPALVENFERLRTGVFVAEGIEEIPSSHELTPPTRIQRTYESGFDHDQEWMYFTQQREILGESRSPLKWFRGTVIFRPDRLIDVRQFGPDEQATVINKSVRTAVVPREAPDFHQPVIDPRAISFQLMRSLKYGLASVDDLENLTYKRTDDGSVPAIRRYEAVYQHPDTLIGEVFQFWIDASQGNQITRYELATRDLIRPEVVNPPYAVTETTWAEKKEGLWLPVTVSMRDQQRTLSLTFDWRLINEPIPEEKFTLKGLSLPNRISTPVN